MDKQNGGIIYTKGYYRENKRNKLIQLRLEEPQILCQEEAATKEYVQRDFICEFWKQAKTSMMIEIRIVVASGGGNRCGLTAKRHKGTFCGDGYVSYLDLADECMDVYIYTNFRYILKICAFCGIYIVPHQKQNQKKVLNSGL